MKPSEIVKDLRFLALLPINEDSQDVIREAANLIESLIPKPISEAPKDGRRVLGFGHKHPIMRDGDYHETWFYKNEWFVSDLNYAISWKPTHFIPLSSIQKLMEGGE